MQSTLMSALRAIIVCMAGLVVACASTFDGEAPGSVEEGLTKGAPGAQIGHSNYCDDPGNRCSAGEGDCDYNVQCDPELVCGRGKLTQFGYPAGGACVPAHCVNEVRDADETQIDCGGSCGSVCAPPVCLPNGSANRCNSDCPCGIGEGDCDSSAQCQPSLVCGSGKLRQFGPFQGGACVPSHCTNHIEDGDETSVDCGGDCGTVGCPAAGCLDDGATYVISIEGSYRLKWPKRHHEWGACSVRHGSYERTLRATVADGMVELVGWGFAGTYPVVDQSEAGFTVRAGSMDGPDFRCGNALPRWDNHGEVTLVFGCADGSVTFSAACSSNLRGDGCHPNYFETATGTGTRVEDDAAE